MKYQEYREEAKTGDLVFFSGTGLVSRGIRLFVGSKWSHVGLILADHEHNLISVWESTTLKKGESFVSGVQTNPLSLRCEDYWQTGGDVAVRRKLDPLKETERESLRALRHEFADRPYEEDYCELLRSAYDGPFGKNTRDVSSLFCSELVAEALRAWGGLGGELPSNEYTPADFAVWKSLGYHELKEVTDV